MVSHSKCHALSLKDLLITQNSLVVLILIFAVGTANCFGQNSPANETSRPLEADEVARIEPEKLKQLAQKSQDQIEVISKLDGVLLVDIRMGPANDRRERPMMLQGRVRDAQQRALVAKLVTRVMQTVSFWSTSDDEFVINPDKLVVMEPSTQEESKNLTRAIELFLSGQYDQADAFFTKALVESQNREPIHYWKVANAIALGQTDRAERRLEVLVRNNPKGSDTYAARLQRLQGPYRRALNELEEKVTLKSRLGVDTKPK